MEIVGVGSNIVECLRVGRMIEEHGELFLLRVFTEREIRYCQSRQRSTEQFAANWAAKEAILKCLDMPWRRGLSWTDIEVRQEQGGRPRVMLCGAAKDIAQTQRISDILVSLSHCRAYATAYAMTVRIGTSTALNQ
jgi:holo-[acyl-carrier protein] synthase